MAHHRIFIDVTCFVPTIPIRMGAKAAVFTLLLFIGVTVGCRRNANPVSSGSMASSGSAAATLESLRRVDDYPMYTMVYSGGYGFAEYLKTGNQRFPALSGKSQAASLRWGCSCFAALTDGERKWFGRNFDWYNRASLVLFTDSPDGYASVSVVDPGMLGCSANPDFNDPSTRERLLGAPYVSLDGMNERGIAIGMMAVPQAQAPYDPARVTIGELQVIRMVLDYAETTDDAVRRITGINVRMDQPPIHYLIADRSGKSVAVEFVGGFLRVIPNTQLWHVATNFVLWGSGVDSDPALAGCARYRLLSKELASASGKIEAGDAQRLLERVSQTWAGGGTMWSAVYDLSRGEMKVAPGRKFNAWKTFRVPDPTKGG